MQRINAILQRKWFRYIIVGGVCGVLSYGIFSLAYLGFGIQYAVSTAIGGVGAWLFNFPLHKWWTFSDKDRTKKATSIQTISHGLLKTWNNLGAAPLLVIFFVEYLGMSPMLANPIAGVLLGIVQNYPINRFVIFKRPPK